MLVQARHLDERVPADPLADAFASMDASEPLAAQLPEVCRAANRAHFQLWGEAGATWRPGRGQ